MRLSTEALARASARHPWRVVGVWAAVLAAAGLTAVLFLGSALTTEADVAARTEAKRGQELIEAHFPGRAAERELVVVRSRGVSLEDGAFAVTLGRLVRRLEAEEAIVSPDGRSALLWFRLGAVGPLEEALEIVEQAGADPGLDVALYGGAVVDRDFNQASREDLEKGETFGVAAALVVLVLVFGAVVAAFVPLVLAAVAIGVSPSRPSSARRSSCRSSWRT